MRLGVLTVLAALPGIAADPHIGTIDFYGYGSLDVSQLRASLPYRVGDPVPSQKSRTAAEQAFAKATGRERASISALCCLPDGRTALFAGLPDPEAPPLAFLPRPTGTAKLPGEIVKLYRDIDHETGIAVKSGHAGEDDSHGYSLAEYAPERALQLKLRDYARDHTAALYQVLQECPDDEHRAAAAEGLGYADESRQQIAGLVRASLDSNDEVRNNAIRALGVLVSYDPKALPDIPLEPYIALIHSIDWFDRNKTAFLLESFTRSRNPEVLQTLRAQALAPLREMARWQSRGHAFPAIQILGRIAGLDEERILKLAIAGDPAPILEALRQ